MFGKKKTTATSLSIIDHKRIFEILLRRLKNETGGYDVEAVWMISRLATLLSCHYLILEQAEQEKIQEQIQEKIA